MLKRLRLKFILTNTLYVGIVLVGVFIMVCFMYRTERVDKLLNTLRMSLGNESSEVFVIGVNKYVKGAEFAPHCVVSTDESGNVLSIREVGATMSAEVLPMAVKTALSASDDFGSIDSDIFFARRTNAQGGFFIAFADDSFINKSTKELGMTFLLVYLCAMAFIVVVSILVAKIALLSIENTWESQKRFIADASHALKTPLTVILANMGILKNGALAGDPEARRWLSNTEEEAKDMHSLINEMLVLAQSDLNVKRASFTQVNLSELITGLTLQFEALAFDKGITIETRVQEGIELRGHEKALSQMAAALIENAIKYEKEGGLVRVRLDKQVRKTVLGVYNASTCIRPEEAERIFERFCRAKTSSGGVREGHGLGLAIARSVADAHDAVLDVDSSPNAGTEFRVTFRHII